MEFRAQATNKCRSFARAPCASRIEGGHSGHERKRKDATERRDRGAPTHRQSRHRDAADSVRAQRRRRSRIAAEALACGIKVIYSNS